MHRGGALGDLERQLSAGAWILEIQTADPQQRCSASHEALLV